MTSTEQRRPSGWLGAASLAADDAPIVSERKAYSRVTLTLGGGLVDDGILTTEGRSVLWGLSCAPAGTMVMVDVSPQRYLIAAAVDLFVKAADHGVVFVFSHHDFRIASQWRDAILAGRVSREYR